MWEGDRYGAQHLSQVRPDLSSLLRREAGVDIVRSGGAGQQTSVFLRGTNSNQILVLIDGVRVASANTGAYAWEQLPLAAIQRIEIVRGPRAAQWGSAAFGVDLGTRARLRASPFGQRFLNDLIALFLP